MSNWLAEFFARHPEIDRADLLNLACARWPEQKMADLRRTVGDGAFEEILERHAGSYLRMAPMRGLEEVMHDLKLVQLLGVVEATRSGDHNARYLAERQFMSHAAKRPALPRLNDFAKAVEHARSVRRELRSAKSWMEQES